MDATDTQPLGSIANLPIHVQILHTIRHILKHSNEPYRTVHTCLEFVDSLIEQSAKGKDEDECNVA